jgi:hypothetical protein
MAALIQKELSMSEIYRQMEYRHLKLPIPSLQGGHRLLWGQRFYKHYRDVPGFTYSVDVQLEGHEALSNIGLS